MNSEQQPLTFINAVDEEMHDNILRLDQKLKGLLAEINAKIDALSHENDNSERKQQLVMLSGEVTQAINSIKNLVELVVSDDLNNNDFVEMNRDNLEVLREIFKDNIDRISKINEQF